MTMHRWTTLAPSLLLGLGILAATWVAKHTADWNGLALTGPLLLACCMLAADLLTARLQGLPGRPTAAALIMAGSFVLMGLLLTLRDTHLLASMLPIVGATSWIALLRDSPRPRKPCY